MLYTILQIVLVFVAVGLVTLILLQQGKGADAGAAFGSGASATVFGAQGSGNFLSRATGVLAALFFLLALSMAYFARHASGPTSVVERAAPTQSAAPAQKKKDGKRPAKNLAPSGEPGSGQSSSGGQR